MASDENKKKKESNVNDKDSYTPYTLNTILLHFDRPVMSTKIYNI